jgi:glutamate/tyrosine decarboxylase-like PLP-dependent enzyme
MTATTPLRGSDDGFALDMSAEEFRALGHRLIDELAAFYESLPKRRVTSGASAREIRARLPRQPLPARGRPAGELLAEITPLLMQHSLFNGHPRFLGYITSSAAPLGALADLLAAAINQNCGLRNLSPVANEIEMQAVDWLAELVGFPRPCGGILVSGGNMANLLGFFAARHARLPWDARSDGMREGPAQPVVYASRETHTWIQKAADISGIGTNAIRWIATDSAQRLRLDELERSIAADRAAGHWPFLIVGTAGNVSTGAVDPLTAIAAVAARERLWLHVDGAYGAPAAVLREAPEDLKALALADSVALDPHKWLYNPIEVACTLVRDPAALRNAFSYRPAYYRFEEDAEGGGLDYFEHGLQNTRGFRALKVWLCLQQAGRDGYAQRIRADIDLARRLHELAMAEPELEAGTQHLSITTLRYVPPDVPADTPAGAAYLDELNRRLVAALQTGGEVYVSNAVIEGRQFLRACIVNFRTTKADIEALVKIVVLRGREIHATLRA